MRYSLNFCNARSCSLHLIEIKLHLIEINYQMILQCFSFLFLLRHLIFHVDTRLDFWIYILDFITSGISLNYQCLHLLDKVSANVELRDYRAITSKQTNKETNNIKEKQWEKHQMWKKSTLYILVNFHLHNTKEEARLLSDSSHLSTTRSWSWESNLTQWNLKLGIPALKHMTR